MSSETRTGRKAHNVQPGTLRFKGPTKFANGFWAGVELDKSEGSNNGTYDGVVYFECEERHGIFAPPDKITYLPEKFEIFTDTTEDEDSFFDDLPDKDRSRHEIDESQSQKQRNLKSKGEETSHKQCESGDKELRDELDHPDQHQKSQTSLRENSHLNSHNKEFEHPVPNVTLCVSKTLFEWFRSIMSLIYNAYPLGTCSILVKLNSNCMDGCNRNLK
uniref:CAP-Gly domain-containing protein n=1 Tax=Myripristis murdjan TaxID=586833 RepID=A0A667WZF9_9TELE